MELFVKEYADVMKAYFAAMLLDSGNIGQTFKIFRQVMSPDYIQSIPNLENQKTIVESILSHKPYAKNCKVSH